MFLGELTTKLKVLRRVGPDNVFLLADAIFANEKTLHEFDDKLERITFKLNDLSQTFFSIPDASLLITGILSILKPDVMTTKGYSFQDVENTIVY